MKNSSQLIPFVHFIGDDLSVMRLLKPILAAGIVMLAEGCAHRPVLGAEASHQRFSVSFPSVKVAKNEFIQSVEVEVRCGRIVSIRRLLFDWDLKVEWDSTSYLKLSTRAGHFSAGLSSMDELADFITVQDAGDKCFNVTATLVTDSTDPTGHRERKYGFSHAELILKPILNRR